jgi:thioredoxin reductase (NADPH)
VIRGECLKTTLSQYLVDRIHATPNIEVLRQTEVTGLSGDTRCLEEITLTNRKTGESKQVKTKFLFVCIGGAPNTQWAGDLGIVRDNSGYLVTGPDLIRVGKKPASWPLDRDPYYLETSMPGLFAAGDVRHGSVKRCASAVGEGAMAVSLIHRYLASG